MQKADRHHEQLQACEGQRGRVGKAVLELARASTDQEASIAVASQKVDSHHSLPRSAHMQAEARLPHTAEKHHGGMADGLQGLRSRLAGIKDSFLKGRWSGQHRASQEHARPSSSGAAPQPAQCAQPQPPAT